MSNERPRPPEEWLEHLHGVGQWARLVEMSREVLAVDPDDEQAHYHLAWAMIRTGQAKSIGPNVEFLLRVNPESLRSRQLGALYNMEIGRFDTAWQLINSALATDPMDGAIHQLAAMLATKQTRWDVARKHCRIARSLLPDSANIAHLDIVLNSIGDSGPVQAWKKIASLEEALALEPEHDGMIASIGDVYLNELEDPKTAESFYRRALAIDPHDKRHQKRLWKAIKSRSLAFRVLRVPLTGWEYVGHFLRGISARPLRCLYLVIGIKVVLLFIAWLLVMTFFFAPAAICFEWLVIADITRASRLSDKLGRWTLGFHRLPFAVRFCVCLALTCGMWAAVFLFFGWPLQVGFFLLGGLYAVHFLFIGLLVLVRRSNSALARRKALKRATPPPLPKR